VTKATLHIALNSFPIAARFMDARRGGKMEAGVTYLNMVGTVASGAANKVWRQKARCALTFPERQFHIINTGIPALLDQKSHFFNKVQGWFIIHKHFSRKTVQTISLSEKSQI
jgi:hypothetical protein